MEHLDKTRLRKYKVLYNRNDFRYFEEFSVRILFS